MKKTKGHFLDAILKKELRRQKPKEKRLTGGKGEALAEKLIAEAALCTEVF